MMALDLKVNIILNTIVSITFPLRFALSQHLDWCESRFSTLQIRLLNNVQTKLLCRQDVSGLTRFEDLRVYIIGKFGFNPLYSTLCIVIVSKLY